MSYNNIFSDNSHLSHRILKDPVKVNLGDKLNKVRDRKHAQKEIAIYDVNDKPTFQNVSDYGLTLLDTLSLGDLKASILETSEEAIRLTADSNNEINFFTGGTTASNLRMQIKDVNTKITNNLLVDNIEDEAGNTVIKSTSSTNTTFTKALNTFQLDNVSPTGYISIQHSNSSKSSYIQWYSYDSTGQGSYPRNAYMGLSSHVGGGVGDDLKLSLENNVNFHILKDSTSIMNFDNVNNKIVVSNPMDLNNNLIMNNSKTQYLYDDTHTIGSERDKDNIKNSIWGLNNSVSDFGTLSLCAGGSQNKTNKSRIQLYGYGVAEKIQMLIGDNKLYTCTDTQNTFYRPIYVNWNGGNGKKITIQGGNCDYSLYTSSAFGGEINIAHNISYAPYTEVESVTTNSLYTSKIIVSNQGIKFRHSDSVNTLPTTDIATFNNSSATFNKDVNIQGINKLNFSSNNYLQNDASHHLNLFLNNNKNFVANTGNDKSTYEFKIDDNSVLKMTRDLTTNPLLPVNQTQVSSGKLTVKDDAVTGGYVELERTGPSGTLAGYINYYNSSGRLFYTGFNSGLIGNPVHYFEDQCLTYTFKNYLGNIMKIVSYENGGTFNATSNYVEIGNILKTPTIDTTNIRFTGQTSNAITLSSSDITCSKDVIIQGTSVKLNFNSNNYLQNDGNNHLNLFINSSKNFVANTGDTVSTYDYKINSVSKLKITDIDTTISTKLICPTINTTNIQLTGETSNAITLATDLITLNKPVSVPNLFTTNNVFPSFNNSYDLGSASLRYNDVYSTNLNFATCDATGQCNIATILCSTDLITASTCNIKMNNITETKSIIPLAHDTYNIGASNNFYNTIFCDILDCESGSVGANAITSDRRLKTDIIDLDPKFGLDFVNRMRPVSYTYKGKTRTHFGLIADDLYDLLQSDKYSIWSKLKDEQQTQTIQTQEFIGVFIKSIQELYGLITTTDKKPIIIKEQVKSENHKCNCNSVELISQLNSYEIELLEKGEQLKVLDNQLEEMVEDNLSLKKNSNIIIERLNKLELKNKELENKLNEKTNEIIDEDTDGGSTSLLDSLQIRNHENELKISKLENKLKRMSAIINKLVKNSNV
jgi:hypothetical protein